MVAGYDIYLLFGNAAIIHIYMFMRDLPRGLPFFHLIAERLRSSIECINLLSLYEEFPELVLWVLVMGGLGGNGTPNRAWYATLLAQICLVDGIRVGNAIAHVLAEFLWSEWYRSPVTVGFWNDVARAQGMHEGYEVRKITDHVSASTFNAPPNMEE